MRGGRFGTGMNMFMSVHRQTLEADHAARARLRAYDMQRAMRNAEPSDDLGNARLADNDDIEASGLFGNDGIFLGGLNGRLLFFNGDGPLITFARTGAGKGRDLILPNLAHLRGRSLVVVDHTNTAPVNLARNVSSLIPIICAGSLVPKSIRCNCSSISSHLAG
jgi:type IV secretion system protein VirD4